MKLVKVSWIDATTIDYAECRDKIKNYNPVEAETVGFLVEDSKDKVIVSLINFHDYEYQQESFKYSQIIPRALIKEIIELNEGGPYGRRKRRNPTKTTKKR